MVEIGSISCKSELAIFQREIGVATIPAKSIPIGSCGARITLVHPFIGDDIDDSAYTFGIVTCSRVGDYLYILYAVRRHAFQHLRRIVRDHVRRFTVQVDLKT